MDFITRDRYRHGLEDLARGSKKSEIEVANAVLKKIEMIKLHSAGHSLFVDEKKYDIGYYLISAGRYDFEKEIGFNLKLKKRILRWHVLHGKKFYIGTIFLFSLVIVLMCLSSQSSFILFLLAIFPASDIAISIVNRISVGLLGPKHLPRFDLEKGIPSHLKTFVVVPTFLSSEEEIEGQVKQLEVHYLSNPNSNVHFAILSDWKDAFSEHMPNDLSLLHMATQYIESLNVKYGPGPEGKNRFFVLHRKRLWNKSEQKWIGWERKRGKLVEFNHLLRGAKDTSFIFSKEIEKNIPQDVKYVITLDADTKLPKNSVAQLVGTFAHPLNHPKFDEKINCVVEGYGILQPRITPRLSKFSSSLRV